jgi:REP element-mobilizing transposase RayT
MGDKFQNKYRIESARLQNWNYSWNGFYFVTICTKNRECFLGNITDGKMKLSDIGKMARKYWLEIPNHFPFVQLDAFVVMPNHVHGIIIIDKTDNIVGRDVACNVSTVSDKTSIDGKNENMALISPKQGSLSTIIRSYKSVVTKHARKTRIDFSWQPRFYDHIIRNDNSYQNISEYIINNPLNWNNDKLYLDR